MATNETELFASLIAARAAAERARLAATAARASDNPALAAQLSADARRQDTIANALNIAYNQAVASPGTASAGQVIAEDQQARDDNSTLQNPSQPLSVLTAEGRINPNNIETGTNATTRTLSDTQSTPQPRSVPFSIRGDEDSEQFTLPGIASTRGGAGSGSDDSAQPQKNITKIEIDNLFNDAKIVPQPNVLDQYASYTYNASLYLMKPEALAAMIRTNKKTIAGTQLLIQSGGAPVQGRNPFFSNDYYIEKIQLKSSIAGKGSQTSHNVNTVTMTVMEPNGITLLRNLDDAVQQYLGGTAKKRKNFSSQLYLLVIRFYGYDDAGNLVQGGQNGAFVEKYYPLAINNIKFKVANKLVEYEITASSPKYTMNVGQMRGTIPYNVELAAMSIKDVLAGNADVRPTAGSTAPANPATPVRSTDIARLNELARDNGVSAEGEEPTPPAPLNAGAAPNPKLTVRKGLFEAMNQFQLDLVSRNIYTYPDVYTVEFVTPAIAQAQIKKVGGDKKSSGSPAPATAKDQLDGNTQAYDPKTRIISALAGTQMVQFLDQILRNSTYIEDQQTVKIEEDTQKQVKNGKPAKNLAWYKISLEAIPGQYDPKRNDYAYNMKYIIHPYRIADMASGYFAQPKFNGVHKQYNYWFTGENTQVLSYEQTYNSQYTVIMSGGPASPYNTQNDNIKFNWQTRSNESSQGAEGRANEPAANAADFLYNPSDLSRTSMTIVGDPAWLQQGEAFAMPSNGNFNFGAFLPDGTINYESQDILFEIFINTPGDYNLNTGLMDPNQRSVINPAANRPGQTKQSYVYKATTVVSDFVKGKFTQQLNGSLLVYYQDQSVKEPGAGRSVSNTLINNARSNINTANNFQNEEEQEVEGDRADSGVPPEAPDQQGNEGVVLLNPDPQPYPAPEPATSSGDINGFGNQSDVQIAGVNSESQNGAREA